MKWIFTLLLLILVGCGTFNLGNVHPQANKTAEQQQLDTLTCKDQANLAVNTAGRQTEDFLLGFTIVGAPVAYERDKAKEREVFTQCMQARGYTVSPPDKSQSPATPQATTAASQAVPAPIIVPGVAQLAFAPPAGFEIKPTPAIQGAVYYALNRGVDIGVLVTVDRHEGISDLMAYTLTKRAAQIDRLTDTDFSDLTRLQVNGRQAYRFSVRGWSNKKLLLMYMTTVIEGNDQIVIINAWAGATNAEQQKALIESLASCVSGIS